MIGSCDRIGNFGLTLSASGAQVRQTSGVIWYLAESSHKFFGREVQQRKVKLVPAVQFIKHIFAALLSKVSQLLIDAFRTTISNVLGYVAELQLLKSRLKRVFGKNSKLWEAFSHP